MLPFDDFTQELNTDEFEDIDDVEKLLAEFSDEPDPGDSYYEENLEDTVEIPKPRKKRPRKRRKKRYFLRLLVFVFIVFLLQKFAMSDFFTVREIDVEGNAYYTASQVFALSGLRTGENLFTTKTSDAKKALLADPYIKLATIKKVPRGTIRIIIEERSEYAAVPYGDKYILIDETGMVLRIGDQQPALPLLEGMSIIDMRPGEPLEVEQSYLLTDTLALLAVMEENDIYFKKVNFSKVVVRAYIYDELYCEGTPANITSSMKVVRKLVSELYTEGIDKGIIKVGKDNYIAFDPRITE